MYRHKVLVIGGRDLTRGFALAGAETRVAESPADASDMLASARDSGEYGVVILDATLADGLDEKDRQSLTSSDVPVVITVPGEMRWRDVETLPPDEYAAKLIRQAIGYQLDIQI